VHAQVDACTVAHVLIEANDTLATYATDSTRSVDHAKENRRTAGCRCCLCVTRLAEFSNQKRLAVFIADLRSQRLLKKAVRAVRANP
jgi:hypothetical protein